MAVSIDPSEVRPAGASVKPAAGPAPAPALAGRLRLPLRAVLVGGVGGLGLVAFTVGAFSFFSGLADPRARSPRITPVAARMPNLKDGIPALAPEPEGSGTASGPERASHLDTPRLNLPREPAPAVQAAQPAAPADLSLRRTEAAETRQEAAPPPAARPAPPIQNAALVTEAPRAVALVPPARSETVKAKDGPVPAGGPAAPAAEDRTQRAPDLARDVHKPAARTEPRPSPAPTAQRKSAARTVAAAPRTTSDPVPAAERPAAPAEDDEVIPGGRHIRAGLKAIGGMFGGSDAD